MPNKRVAPPLAPRVLEGVPQSVIRSVGAHDALFYALDAEKHPNPYGPIVALHTLESYFDAAKRQQRRIEKASASRRKPPISRRPRVRNSLFEDIHFYLICWARIAKLGRYIANETKWRRIGLVLRRYHPELEKRRNGRDYLEHFEERVPGTPKYKKMRVPNDLFNMTNNHATFGGNSVNVGPESIRLLKAIIEEFRQALIFDAVESLAKADLNRMSRLLGSAASTVRTRSTIRRAKTIMRRSDHLPSP